NARDAMPDGGRLEISVRHPNRADRATLPSGSAEGTAYVCLDVSDTGTGMDAHTLQRALDPFFTTKPPGKGTGLGLAMVQGIMGQHGGVVHITSQAGLGTSVRLLFPAAKGE